MVLIVHTVDCFYLFFVAFHHWQDICNFLANWTSVDDQKLLVRLFCQLLQHVLNSLWVVTNVEINIQRVKLWSCDSFETTRLSSFTNQSCWQRVSDFFNRLVECDSKYFLSYLCVDLVKRLVHLLFFILFLFYFLMHLYQVLLWSSRILIVLPKHWKLCRCWTNHATSNPWFQYACFLCCYKLKWVAKNVFVIQTNGWDCCAWDSLHYVRRI